MEHVDVVIVGCGPVGSAAANLLSERGHSVAVLDEATEFHGETRAVHMDHETMRIFRGIGIDDRFKPYYTPFEGMEFLDDQHRRMFLLKAADARSGEQGYMFSQPQLELSLREQLDRRDNVSMMLGHRVTDLSQSGASVDLSYEIVASGEVGSISAAYVIGCDGATSFVRKHVGIELEDLGFDEPWVVVDCDLLKPVDLPNYGQQVCDIRRPSTFIPAENDHRRWEFMLLPGEKPEEVDSEDKLFELMAPWGIARENLRIRRTAVYTFHALISKKWRVGRVFVAGDACHQTPVFIGQGMCAGIRDAANLSWKLSLVLDGLADDGILDSYQLEREPHVRSVIMESVKQGQIICTTDPELAKVRDQVIDDLSKIPNLSFYDSLPDLTDGILRNPSDDSLAGNVAIHPMVEPADGPATFLDNVSGTGFRLITRDTEPFVDLSEEAQRLWQRLDGRCVTIAEGASRANGTLSVTDVDGRLGKLMDDYGIESFLVRPDHYVYGIARDRRETSDLLAGLGTQLGMSA